MRIDPDKKFIMMNIKELSELKDKQATWTRNYGQGSGERFSRDPDSGTLNDRLSGRFDWAFQQIAKHKDTSGAGNVESLQPEYEFGLLDGTEVDMDQYMVHNPRCLGRVIHSQAPNGDRVINLAVGIGMSGGTPAEVLAQNSAAVVATAKKYEDAGYSVRLTAFFPVKHMYSGSLKLVVVDCSLCSVGQAVSILCSALVFRTLVFDALDMIGCSPNEAQAVSRLQNSYEMPKMKEILKGLIGKDTKVIFTGDTESDIMTEINSN